MESQRTVTLHVTRRFDASAERVFDAWLDPAKAGKFLFATATGTLQKVEIDARSGGKFEIVDRRDGADVAHIGRYVAVERPRKLVFTFAVPKYSKVETLVTLEISPAGAGCELTLTHSGVLPDWARQTEEGWGKILDGLAANL